MQVRGQTSCGAVSILPVRSWSNSEKIAATLLLTPVVVLFGLSVIYPLFETILLSFWDIRGLAAPKWAGLDNYRRLFSDPLFQDTLWTTLYFTIGVTVLSVGVGWVLAMLCAFAPRQTAPFRLMIFATFGISEAVSATIWMGIFRPDHSGMLNAALLGLGLLDDSVGWLGDPTSALVALIIVAAWSAVGLPLLLCFAAVQAIPKSVIEAAYMDGAKPLDVMRRIMMPLSLSGVRVAVFINLLSALRAFDIIFILTGGGPARSTETVGFFMFREAMVQFKLGYGAAATLVLLVAVLVVSLPAIIKRTAAAR